MFTFLQWKKILFRRSSHLPKARFKPRSPEIQTQVVATSSHFPFPSTLSPIPPAAESIFLPDMDRVSPPPTTSPFPDLAPSEPHSQICTHKSALRWGLKSPDFCPDLPPTQTQKQAPASTASFHGDTCDLVPSCTGSRGPVTCALNLTTQRVP